MAVVDLEAEAEVEVVEGEAGEEDLAGLLAVVQDWTAAESEHSAWTNCSNCSVHPSLKCQRREDCWHLPRRLLRSR